MTNMLSAVSEEEAKKMTVFLKGHPIHGYDPREWCHDDHGNVLKYSAHGDRSSPYGWEMDHIQMKVLGGGDDVSNLRPLHCKLNALQGGLASGLGALGLGGTPSFLGSVGLTRNGPSLLGSVGVGLGTQRR